MKQFVKAIIIGFCCAAFGACSSNKEKLAAGEEGEYRLKEDRSNLDELRKNVPEDVKQKNDETAFILGLMAEGKTEPSDVTSRFNTDIRKKRDQFAKEEQQKRDTYNREERLRRENFLAQLKETREKAIAKKMSSDQRSEFFSQESDRRNEFFENERDKRRDFDSNLREKRDDFEAYLRDVRSKFDQEYKEYSKNFYERRRAEEALAVQKQNMRLKKEPEKSAAPPPGFTEEDMQDVKANSSGRKTRLTPDDDN